MDGRPDTSDAESTVFLLGGGLVMKGTLTTKPAIFLPTLLSDERRIQAARTSSWVEQRLGLELTPRQKAAVRMIEPLRPTTSTSVCGPPIWRGGHRRAGSGGTDRSRRPSSCWPDQAAAPVTPSRCRGGRHRRSSSAAAAAAAELMNTGWQLKGNRTGRGRSRFSHGIHSHSRRGRAHRWGAPWRRPRCCQIRWERFVQRLEITSGEWLPDQEIPLLQSPRGTVPGS